MNKMTSYKTTPFMTKYEKAKILGTRALQINMGSPILVDPNGSTDALRIALIELREKKMPLKLIRTLPDGTTEIWDVNKMIV